MLGYSYIQSGHPDPVKAVTYEKRYIAADPSSPNPEDSMGEVLRYTGDDQGSLEHYSAALQIDPTFFNSQLGLGDTLTLMGKYDDARLEYDKAVLMSENNRDLLHASYQKALVYFWEGRAEEGRSALSNLAADAAQKNEPNGQFEIAFGSAMLAADFASELHQLRALEEKLQNAVEGMSASDRSGALANVLCEEARVASQHGLPETAEQAISKLERLAAQTADLLVENPYETARGYLLLSQGDLANAVDELSANRLSPLAVQQLAVVQQKLGNQSAAGETANQLKYQRARDRGMVSGEPERQHYPLEFFVRLIAKHRTRGLRFWRPREYPYFPKFVLGNRAWLPPTWRGQPARWLKSDQEMLIGATEAKVSQACRSRYRAASWI